MSKLQELDRSACVAWSRSSAHPRLLATATAAGSLDRDFSTSAQLEIFALNESHPNVLSPQGRIDLPDRVNRLEWGIVDEKVFPCGILACAHTEGTIGLYNAAKLKSGSGAEAAVFHQARKHNGPVISLEFNAQQPNLLASAGQDNEILIWDLSKVLLFLVCNMKRVTF
jgi:protein transport protein SEC31